MEVRADEEGRVTASPRPVELSLRMGTFFLVLLSRCIDIWSKDKGE